MNLKYKICQKLKKKIKLIWLKEWNNFKYFYEFI